MGVGEIGRVEQVLDVQLQLDSIADPKEDGGVEAGEGGQPGGGDRGPDGGELAGLVDHAEAETQSAAEVVAIPQAELLLRRLGQSDGLIALQPGIEPGIAAADLPVGPYSPGQRQFDTLGAGLADVDGYERVQRVRSGGIDPVEAEEGRSDVQVGPDVPFGPDLVIDELLGLKVLLGG